MTVVKKSAEKRATRTLAAFNAEHDPAVIVPTAIKKGLASLLAEGAEAWEYELEFMKRCVKPNAKRVTNSEMADYRDQFEDHFVIVKSDGKNEKRVWFADPKIAKKARGS